MQYFFFDMCSIQIMPVPFAHTIYTSISKIYEVLLPFQMSICFCSYIFLLLHKLVTSVFIWCWILVLKFSSKSQHDFLKHRFGHVNSVLEPFRVSHGLQKSARSRREKKKIPGRLFVQSQATLSTLQSACSKGRSHIAK